MKLIDADVLIKYFEGLARSLANARVFVAADTAQGAAEKLRSAPAVDAEPVRQATLKATGFDEIYCEWGDCTNCGTDNMMSSKFCRECGASLRRGK